MKRADSLFLLSFYSYTTGQTCHGCLVCPELAFATSYCRHSSNRRAPQAGPKNYMNHNLVHRAPLCFIPRTPSIVGNEERCRIPIKEVCDGRRPVPVMARCGWKFSRINGVAILAQFEHLADRLSPSRSVVRWRTGYRIVAQTGEAQDEITIMSKSGPALPGLVLYRPPKRACRAKQEAKLSRGVLPG